MYIGSHTKAAATYATASSDQEAALKRCPSAMAQTIELLGNVDYPERQDNVAQTERELV
jgi:hypothetical protein